MRLVLPHNGSFVAGITIAVSAAAGWREDRGVRLGGLRDKTMKRNEAIQRKAKAEAEKAMRIIGPLRSAGQTLTAIADTMKDMGAKTSRGGRWSATQVMRVLDRTGTCAG